MSPWVKLDDHFDEHTKIAALSDSAFRLYVSGLTYCNRNLTDGFVPDVVARRMATRKHATSELEKSHIWERVEGGWKVHDYLNYQPSKEKILSERESKRIRVANYRTRTRASEGDTTEPSPRTPRRPKNAAPHEQTEPEGFAAFYDEAYPRRVDRPAALKAWKKLNPDEETRQRILAGAKMYADACAGKEPQYIKHPGPWLNARRWEDDPPATASSIPPKNAKLSIVAEAIRRDIEEHGSGNT